MKHALKRLLARFASLVPLAPQGLHEEAAAVEGEALVLAEVIFSPVPDGWTVEDVMAETGCTREQAELRMQMPSGVPVQLFQYDHNRSLSDYLRAHPGVSRKKAKEAVAWAQRDFSRLRSDNPAYISRFAGDPWKVVGP